MTRAPYYAYAAEAFEGFLPQFPMMLDDENHGIEWENLTTIAEHTDDERDWVAVAQYEGACDHMVFEGRWGYADVHGGFCK
jgi:hypothetical protein